MPLLLTITRRGSGDLPSRGAPLSQILGRDPHAHSVGLRPSWRRQAPHRPETGFPEAVCLSVLLVKPVGVRLRVETFPSAVRAKFAMTRGRFVDLITLCLRWILRWPELRPAPRQDAARRGTINQVHATADKAPENDHEKAGDRNHYRDAFRGSVKDREHFLEQSLANSDS